MAGEGVLRWERPLRGRHLSRLKGTVLRADPQPQAAGRGKRREGAIKQPRATSQRDRL